MAGNKEAIRIICFDGKEDKWREWFMKAQSIGMHKGWWDAVDPKFVYEGDKVKKEEKDTLMKKNNNAFHFLILACQEEALTYVWSANKSASKAWANLKSRYESSDESDLIDLIELFNDCTMKDETKDPRIWFAELEYLRGRMLMAGHEKKEPELIAHVLKNAPKSYKTMAMFIRIGCDKRQ